MFTIAALISCQREDVVGSYDGLVVMYGELVEPSALLTKCDTLVCDPIPEPDIPLTKCDSLCGGPIIPEPDIPLTKSNGDSYIPEPDIPLSITVPVRARVIDAAFTEGENVWISADASTPTLFKVMSSSRTSSFKKQSWNSEFEYDSFVSAGAFTAVCPSEIHPVSVAGGLVKVELPSVQEAVENGFDANSMIKSGRASRIGEPMNFRSATSVLEFSLSVPEGYTVKSVDVFAEQVETENTVGELAGYRVVSSEDADSWIAKSDAHSAARRITLSHKDGSELKADSKTAYHVSFWPGLKSDLKVVVNAVDSKGEAKAFVKTVADRATFVPGILYPIGTVRF